MKIALDLVLKNHVYQFNNTVRKQSDGGPIGLDLTEVIAKIFMGWWDQQLLRKLRENGLSVSLYKRYVDDINMSVKSATPASRIVNGILQIDEETAREDMELEKDEMTFKVISQLGESIQVRI